MLFDWLLAISGVLFVAVIVRAELRLKALEQSIADLGSELIIQRREIGILRGAKALGE